MEFNQFDERFMYIFDKNAMPRDEREAPVAFTIDFLVVLAVNGMTKKK